MQPRAFRSLRFKERTSCFSLRLSHCLGRLRMQLRLSLVAVAVCLAAYACATPQQRAATTSAAPAAVPSTSPKPPQQEARYRTGSRVPLRESDEGSQSVSGISKDAYEEEMRRMATP